LFVSTNGKTWEKSIIKGTLKDTEDTQSFLISKVKARYFKFQGLSGYTRKAASVGELSFYGTCVLKK